MSKENITDIFIKSTFEHLQKFSKSEVWKDIKLVLNELKDGGVDRLRDPETPDEDLGFLRGGLAMLDELLVIDETLLEFKKSQQEESKDE